MYYTVEERLTNYDYVCIIMNRCMVTTSVTKRSKLTNYCMVTAERPTLKSAHNYTSRTVTTLLPKTQRLRLNYHSDSNTLHEVPLVTSGCQ